MDVVYLDFDGVLHPAAVGVAGKGDLFESLPVLEELLAPYLGLQIVLSTSWVKAYSYSQCVEFLPESLQPRVVGTTWGPGTPPRFSGWPRWQQLSLDVEYRKPGRWIALDDDDRGWPDTERHHLVCIPADQGLRSPEAQNHVRQRLLEAFGT